MVSTRHRPKAFARPPVAGLAAIAVALGGCAACASGPERGGAAPITIERRVASMGTWLSLEVEGESRPSALAASEAAIRAVEHVETRLSTWRDDSELARLNRSPVGEAFALTPELDRDLRRARSLWRETAGCFDPGVGALVDAWGLRTGGRQPTDDEVAAALAGGGMASLRLHGGSAVRASERLCLEEGGFGKGIGLDAAIDALRSAGATRAVLDMGGQVALLGRGEERFGLADPRDRLRPVVEVRIDHGSIATTASSERGFVVDGVLRSHVLDPRTGHPVADYGSLTVWAGDAATADALSTGLYVMGPRSALEWARERAGVEVLVLVDPGGGEERLDALATDGWRGRLEALVPHLSIHFGAPPEAS